MERRCAARGDESRQESAGGTFALRVAALARRDGGRRQQLDSARFGGSVGARLEQFESGGGGELKLSTKRPAWPLM